jgi:hypothetical protein
LYIQFEQLSTTIPHGMVYLDIWHQQESLQPIGQVLDHTYWFKENK